MDLFRRVLLKIIIFTLIVVIISASIAEAKKSKKVTSKASKQHFEQLEKYHNRAKRSTYSRNWGKANYGNFGLPPYLVYNRKLGAYYPYFKYPENSIRRSMRKSNTRKY
ncbi:hypothetical protein PYW08_005543 [Mythimna loreyi]|uniref:Uncharacterized protein n=1 Tax=Mythimna loreyi TaxID=667449 RepID=A0ACC2QIV7_9NEOP|nr:hypothetical protein PYW08_005543 [Mythimna loreyi]